MRHETLNSDAIRNGLLDIARCASVLATCVLALGLAANVSWRGVNALDLFWQVAVALLPLILLVAPQFWRRICPFAAINVAAAQRWTPRRGIVPRLPREITVWVKRYGVIVGAGMFWCVAPLRLLLFNRSSSATAILILTSAVAALALGAAGPWKALWCSSLCPVYPLEKLYGAAPLWSMPDPRCVPNGIPLNCYRCALHCVDVPRTEEGYWKAMERAGEKPAAERARRFFIGSFPGFVLAYWMLARLKIFAAPRFFLVYAVFLFLMAGSYACYRMAQSWFVGQRVDLAAIALAFNVYYVGASAGLADIFGRLAGSSTGSSEVRATIITLAFLTSMAWWPRARRTGTAPWNRW